MSLISKKDCGGSIIWESYSVHKRLGEDAEIWQVSNEVGKGGGRNSTVITESAY
jgi:hypothetical protein